MKIILRHKTLIGIVFFYSVPFITFAQTLESLIRDKFLVLINPLILSISGIALVFFIWCLAKFILALGKGNENEIDAGKKCMMWGIIALFVLFSFWGVLSVLQASIFGGAVPNPPIGF